MLVKMLSLRLYINFIYIKCFKWKNLEMENKLLWRFKDFDLFSKVFIGIDVDIYRYIYLF